MSDVNPNGYKYFDENYGMTFNEECPKCKTPTFQSESVHTVSVGHKYYRNITGEVVGVVGSLPDAEIYCGKCWDEMRQ